MSQGAPTPVSMLGFPQPFSELLIAGQIRFARPSCISDT
jgi:hypothetical protein